MTKICRRARCIARPVLREEFEEYLSDKVKKISRELEKSGYAEIEYRCSDDAIRDELSGREHRVQKERHAGVERI